ncbi:MAG: hypothetical protein RIM84_11990 [Alphaproteobacteria bacterium]
MTTIDLADLGTAGIRFVGVNTGDRLGYNTGGAAGDLNGDGIDDLILTALRTGSNAGTVYVVFGGSGGLPTNLASLGDGGLTIVATDQDYGSAPALGVGDVNGDGVNDLAIGAKYGGANYEGQVFVVFGGSLADDIAIASLGAAGTVITGVTAGGSANFVHRAGDFDNDGNADLIVGAFGDTVFGTNAGAAYIVYGNGDGLPQTLDLAAVNTDAVSVIFGDDNDYAGFFVSGGGDVNGDGTDDVIVATSANEVHVVFGQQDSRANVDLAGASARIATITGANAGDLNAAFVGFAGDANGDGLEDMLVAAPGYAGGGTARGAVYLIFGSATLGDIDLASLGDAGIRIDGAADGDRIGERGLHGIDGDFNGDGFADFVIGGFQNQAYLIFGGASLPSVLDLGALGDAGIAFTPENAGDRLGISASGAGDVNGDGLADVLLGANGFNAYTGAMYLIYGVFSALATAGDDTLTGAGLDDSIDGGAGDDTIFGNGGNDTLLGNDGVDLLAGGDGNDSVGGGAGADDGYGQAGDDTLLGGTGADNLRGNLDDDMVMGEGGDDTLRGQVGTDMVDGGVDNDMLFGGGGDDSVEGGTGNDVANGNSGADTVNGGDGDDTVRGQGGNDVVNGNDGNDLVLGISGLDSLFGGTGDDTLTGGVGNDQLTGGDGADVFQFGAMQGSDTITDFEDGTDRMSFVGVSTFGDLTIVDTDDGAAITLASEGDSPTLRVTLTGIAADQLDASDFIFS